jgi:hypothetical protein
MQINTITEVTLTKEQIEEAIKEYISRRSFKFQSEKCSIDFKYIDIAEEDDRGPYRPIMSVNSAIVKF